MLHFGATFSEARWRWPGSAVGPSRTGHQHLCWRDRRTRGRFASGLACVESPKAFRIDSRCIPVLDGGPTRKHARNYHSARFHPYPKFIRTKRTSFLLLELVEGRPPPVPLPNRAIHVLPFRYPQSSPVAASGQTPSQSPP